MCSTDSLISEAFPEAIKRADFTISALEQATVQGELPLSHLKSCTEG